MSFLSWPRARQLYRIESLHPPGYLVSAAVLRGAIERTCMFTLKNSEFCPYSLACSVGLSELRAVVFVNGINRLPFVNETGYVLFQVETEFMYVYIIQVNFMRQRVHCTLLSCLLGFNLLMDVVG